jgi:transposase
MDTSTVVEPVATDTLGRRIMPRRFRSVQEKQRIVSEASMPGASMAEVARRHGVNANLVFAWRRLHEQGLLVERTRRRSGKVKLLPVRVSTEVATPASPAGISPCVEIELADGTRIRSYGAVEIAALERIVSLLRR